MCQRLHELGRMRRVLDHGVDLGVGRGFVQNRQGH